MSENYPTTKAKIRKMLKAKLEKGGAKAQRLYMAGVASDSEYASDYVYDELDAALDNAFSGITDTLMEHDDEHDSGAYYYLHESLRALCRTAKLTITF